MKNIKSIIKIITNIIGYMLNVLIVLAIIIIWIGIYYIFQIKVEHKEYANIFGYTFFQISTGSMSPTLEVGDVVIIKITKDIEENEIIVFKEENSLITHRVQQIENENIITRGDANNSEDKPINIDDVVGTMIKVIPKVGLWKKALMQPETIGLIILIIAIICIIFLVMPKMEGKNGKKE